MNRASPADLRKAMEAANHLLKAGIAFVPMPVSTPEELAALQLQMIERLEAMEAEAK
ncbi:DUF1382 family protein [Pseudomonas sp. NPDC078700]|uniref:DUF1382 family protein n=1 Tax=Pseudomonas sp. NPDC078700 TaxID=3364424 RepID=UPI0037CA465C